MHLSSTCTVYSVHILVKVWNIVLVMTLTCKRVWEYVESNACVSNRHATLVVE